mgnify:CR=1 FL=1
MGSKSTEYGPYFPYLEVRKRRKVRKYGRSYSRNSSEIFPRAKSSFVEDIFAELFSHNVTALCHEMKLFI